MVPGASSDSEGEDNEGENVKSFECSQINENSVEFKPV